MSEDTLLKKARCGDAAALDQLCQREWGPVFAIVYSRVKDRHEAEDITQDVFVRALKALECYEETSVPFRAYLATIARNRVRDHWRKRNLVQVALDHAPEPVADKSDPQIEVIGGPLSDHVIDAMASLPTDYRTVLRLRLWEDRPSDEVAAMMGRSAGAVRILQYRALTMLRAILEEGSNQ